MQESLEVPDIVRLIQADEWRMRALEAVFMLGLPDCWIGAGFVRNAVWDALHGYEKSRPLNDVDVLYFDPQELTHEVERRHEGRLAREMPGVPWSVRNQARMHTENGDAPYRSVADAMRYWPETATAVAVRLSGQGQIQFIAAHDILDLVNLELRPTPHFMGKLEIYRTRIRDKHWTSIWSYLTIYDSPHA